MDTVNVTNIASNAPAAPLKSGWKTSEFWLSALAFLVGAVMASGALPGGLPTQIVGGLAVMLNSLGYSTNRSILKRAAPPVAMLAVLLFTGCATPWPALTATAKAGRVAIAGFEQYDHDHKRELVAACAAADAPTACVTAALAPYFARRDPVVRGIDEMVPVLTEAEGLAVQANADRSLTDAVAAKAATMLARVLGAIADLRKP